MWNRDDQKHRHLVHGPYVEGAVFAHRAGIRGFCANSCELSLEVVGDYGDGRFGQHKIAYKKFAVGKGDYCQEFGLVHLPCGEKIG